MKKVVLILAALVLVVSGVAAVSAYEAHIINVKAHVENALTVGTDEIDFGTRFPQEWKIYDRVIALSESAWDEMRGQTLTAEIGDLESVTYEIFGEYKIKTPGETPPGPIFYRWLGEWLWVGIDAADPSGSSMTGWTQVGSQPDSGFSNNGTAGIPDPMAVGTGLTGTFTKPNHQPQTLRVMLLTPAFHGYYNVDTDVKPEWWPLEDWPLLPQDLHDGVDLGLDLKVQVTDIVRVD